MTKVKKREGGLEGYGRDTKRFYSPFYIEWKCPKCGEMIDHLKDYYLSYPPFFVPFKETLYCYECEQEEEITLQLDLELKIVYDSSTSTKTGDNNE